MSDGHGVYLDDLTSAAAGLTSKPHTRRRQTRGILIPVHPAPERLPPTRGERGEPRSSFREFKPFACAPTRVRLGRGDGWPGIDSARRRFTRRVGRLGTDRPPPTTTTEPGIRRYCFGSGSGPQW